MKKFSVSQLKKYNANPAERAWTYILGIKNYSDSASNIAGKMFEERYTKKQLAEEPSDREAKLNERCEKQLSILIDTDERCKAVLLFESLKDHAKNLNTEVGAIQQYVVWKIAWFDFCWYIDNVTEDRIEDYKTIWQAKNLNTISQYSWMTNGDEYELQLRVYMYLTERSKARIIEVNGYNYVKEPKEGYVKIIEYTRTEEMDKKWIAFIAEKCTEMSALYVKFWGNLHFTQ